MIRPRKGQIGGAFVTDRADSPKILGLVRTSGALVDDVPDLVESVFLTMQANAPLPDELMRALEKMELVAEAERVVRGGSTQ